MHLMNLQNFIAYCYMCYTGKSRLDRAQNNIHNTLRVMGFIILLILAMIGFLAVCFIIKPATGGIGGY